MDTFLIGAFFRFGVRACRKLGGLGIRLFRRDRRDGVVGGSTFSSTRAKTDTLRCRDFGCVEGVFWYLASSNSS